MPPFDHLHPAVVHFAIAPLALVPLLLLLALVWPGQRRGLLAAALLAAGVGAGAAVVSALSGQAAERFARATPELRAALVLHEAAGQWVVRMALASAVVVSTVLWLPILLHRPASETLARLLLGAALLLSLGAAVAALRTGHLGGVMVHALGTHVKEPPASM